MVDGMQQDHSIAGMMKPATPSQALGLLSLACATVGHLPGPLSCSLLPLLL